MEERRRWKERGKRECADIVKGTGITSQEGWRRDEREAWTKSERGRRGGRYGLETREEKAQWRQKGGKRGRRGTSMEMDA